MPINILLVDDHNLVTDGLAALLAGVNDALVKGVARNGREALDMLGVLNVDVVLMDLDMPVMDGTAATKIIRQQFPDVRIIILTMHDEKSVIAKLMEIGAHGYLLKNSGRDELLEAIRTVHGGGEYFSHEVTAALIQPDKDPRSGILSNLTEREVEILRCIAEGMSNKEIGDKLFISHRTVDTHRTNLMQKLDVHNVAGLVRIAIQHGLAED